MRIFDRRYENYLPEEVRSGNCLQTYYAFCAEAVRLGLLRVTETIGTAYLGRADGEMVRSPLTDGTKLVVRRGAAKLVLVGARDMPRKEQMVATMSEEDAARGIALNGKFDWRAYDTDGEKVSEGKKPETAANWAGGID